MFKHLKSALSIVIGWLDKFIPPDLDPSDPSEGDMIPDATDYESFDWHGENYRSND